MKSVDLRCRWCWHCDALHACTGPQQYAVWCMMRTIVQARLDSDKWPAKKLELEIVTHAEM